MAVLQTRIFVRADEPTLDWAETLIGRVIRPLTDSFRDSLAWFWFSRYQSRRDVGDCDYDEIPLDYVGDAHRSLRFRFDIDDDHREAFAELGSRLIAEQSYWISDFRAYDALADTGSERFLGTEHRHADRAALRSTLVNNFYSATSRLVIDTLVGPDEHGRYRLEHSDSPHNPQGSTFQSLLHLFCNITSVPTEVEVRLKGGRANCSTYMMQRPPEPTGGWDDVSSHSLMY